MAVSVWFSKKHQAHGLRAGRRPFLVRDVDGNIVAATLIETPNAALRKAYPDFECVAEGQNLRCLATPGGALTRPGAEYAKQNGLAENYEALFSRAINNSSVQADWQQGEELSLIDKNILLACKHLRSVWMTANPDCCYPSDDIMLRDKTGWQYARPGQAGTFSL